MSHNAESFDREMLNIGGKPGITAAFETQWLDAMISREYEIRKAVKHIFITIDPSAAKDRNLYVIMSTVFIDNQCIILGAECMNTCHSLSVAQVVVDHVNRCRQISYLAHALAIIIPESNLPFMATQLQFDIKNKFQLNNHHFPMLDSSGNGQKDLPGSITTHKKKLEMVHILKENYLKPGRILFHSPFICTHTDLMPFDDIRLEIMKQMRGFRQKRWYKTDAEGNSVCQLIFTGKEPVGQNDDFVIVLLIAVLNEKGFFDDEVNAIYW
jgi:hypothetical protein